MVEIPILKDIATAQQQFHRGNRQLDSLIFPVTMNGRTGQFMFSPVAETSSDAPAAESAITILHQTIKYKSPPTPSTPFTQPAAGTPRRR